MAPPELDDLAKRIASGASRRDSIRVALGSLLGGALGLFRGGSAEAKKGGCKPKNCNSRGKDFKCCGNKCTNLDRDDKNCGRCNRNCRRDEVCRRGRCRSRT